MMRGRRSERDMGVKCEERIGTKRKTLVRMRMGESAVSVKVPHRQMK